MQETWVQFLGWEDYLEKGDYPLQYSGLENSMDRGDWQATAHWVTMSPTRLSDVHYKMGKGLERGYIFWKMVAIYSSP